VRRAKDGDRQALEALCARHAPRVERLARHLLGDGEDARDAAQESLAKLCVRIRQFRGESQFATWLHRLVVNTCRDAADRQRRGRRDLRERVAGAEPAADPARAAGLTELRAELCEALASLPEQQQRVVVLRDALGYSFAEIAAATALPVGTAKSHAFRARARLRTRLAAAEAAPAG